MIDAVMVQKCKNFSILVRVFRSINYYFNLDGAEFSFQWWICLPYVYSACVFLDIWCRDFLQGKCNSFVLPVLCKVTDFP